IPAHGEVLRRQHLVPLRRAGQCGHGDHPGESLQGPAGTPQGEDGGIWLHPRMRRGPEQGLRGDCHGEGLEPVCVRQRRDAATPCRSVATDLSDEELLRTIDRVVMFYVRTADRLQRTSVWMENLEGNLEYLKQVVLEDSLGIGEELEQHMADLVDTYQCEWKTAVEDPEKRKRFREFVNAPEQTDPVQQWTSERGQRRPVLESA